MKRPGGHVKEDESLRIFKNALPREWILRPIEPDYGIDKSLEIVEKGIVTGKEISIQLKGTDEPSFKGDSLVFSVETYHLKYYLERDAPVILVVVDLKKEQCYWVFLQDFVFRNLEIRNPKWRDQKYVTVYIPVQQNVSKTAELLKNTAKGGSAYLTMHKILQIPSSHLTRWEDDTEAIVQKTKTAGDLIKKALQIKIETSYDYAKTGKRAESNKVLFDVLKSARAEDKKEIIVTSTLLITYHMNLWGENKEIWELLMSIEKDVQTLDSKIYNILYTGSIFETLFIHHVNEYSSLSTLALVSSQSPRNIMTPYLMLRTQQVVQELYDFDTKYVQNLIDAYKLNQFFIYADLLERLSRMHITWVNVNAVQLPKETVLKLMSDIEKILVLAKTLADALSSELGITVRLDMARLYHFINDEKKRDDCLKEAYDLSNKLQHKGYLEEVSLATLNLPNAPSMASIKRHLAEKPQSEDIPLDEEERIIRMLLKKGGIDIDGNEELSEMARIGLKDLNPERVLRHCEHIYTEIVTHGPIWDMMALPSTGMKILYCEKKGSIMGMSLDMLLTMFKEKHCKDCTYYNPRPVDWKWSRKWHRERRRPEGMEKSIENFYKM